MKLVTYVYFLMYIEACTYTEYRKSIINRFERYIITTSIWKSVEYYTQLYVFIIILYVLLGPIDAVLFQSQNYHLLRHSTITGSCRATDSNGEVAFIPAGPVRVQFSLMECPGFGGFVYDSYTGFNSVSRITIDEIIPSKK